MNKNPHFAKLTTIMPALAAGLLLSSHAGAAVLFSNAADAQVAVSTGGAQTSSVGSTGTSSNIGRQGTDLRTNAVYVFQLPNFGTAVNPFTTASFTFNYRSQNSAGLPDADLYGLARRSASTVLLADFYHGANDGANNRLQQSILTTATTIGLVTSNAGGNTALLSFLNSEYAGGAGAGEFVFLRLNINSTTVNNATRYNVGMSEGLGANVAEINFAAIPEPSIALLSVIGTLLMAGRRRR